MRYHKSIFSTSNIIAISSIFLFLLFINILLPMQSDDYDALFSSKEGFEAAKRFYLTWNARVGELLSKGLVGGFNPYLFDFLNALVGTSFIFGFFILLFARFPRDFKDISMIFLSLFVLMYFCAFGSDFAWGSASLNYTWGLFLIILFLLPFRFYFEGAIRSIIGGGSSIILVWNLN